MDPAAASPASRTDAPRTAQSSSDGGTPEGRILALIEVVLCSGFPTQVALGLLFARLGLLPAGRAATLETRYVVPLLLADTAVLIGLSVLFLRTHGDHPYGLFFGHRSWSAELRAAVPMVFKAYGIALAVLVTVALVVPWLHTVEQNPLQDLLRTPTDVALFALVVIIAGGIREEVQRAFILTRFERSLGGPVVGVVVSSAAFGAGHLIQGADAAIATALLGAFWGASYLRRRSIVAPVVSHAAFDLLQIGVFLATGR